MPSMKNASINRRKRTNTRKIDRHGHWRQGEMRSHPQDRIRQIVAVPAYFCRATASIGRQESGRRRGCHFSAYGLLPGRMDGDHTAGVDSTHQERCVEVGVAGPELVRGRDTSGGWPTMFRVRPPKSTRHSEFGGSRSDYLAASVRPELGRRLPGGRRISLVG